MSVYFSNGDIDFIVEDEILIKKWIADIIARHNKVLGKINYLFCSDQMVYEMNVKYLCHDNYTDIITFDSVVGNLISGDIIISVDRVGENAKTLSSSFDNEFHRVVIHGVLHLLGFKDKSPDEAALMRAKENESLQILDSLMK